MSRCLQSVEYSLQCAWLLDAYIAEQMKTARKPNSAVRLLFDILYEKYKPKIEFIPAGIQHVANQHHNHHRLDEEESESVINQDDEMKTERALSQENLILQVNRKKGHQKSRSDVSGKFEIRKKVNDAFAVLLLSPNVFFPSSSTSIDLTWFCLFVFQGIFLVRNRK
jgi:hypothetical protein